MTTFSRLCAASLAASILLCAPGLAPYAAAASVVVDAAAAAPAAPRGMALPALGAASLGSAASPMTAAPLSAPGLSAFAAPSAAAPSAAAPLAAAPLAAAPAHAAPARTAAPAPALAAASAPARNEAAFESSRRQVAQALDAAGDLSSVSASGLHALGRKLEAALLGAPALSASGDALPAASLSFDDPTDRGGHLARPAGDSIRQAAEALDAHPAPSVTPPAPPSRPAAPAPKGPRGPFWPRVLAAAIALTPAALLGWPLLAAGSTVLGGLVLAGSASLALMPFLSESSPRALRAAPGLLLAGVGVAGALAGLYWPAAFAIVGGWGLVRYGLGESSERRSDAPEALSAFFGGVAALTGVALAAVHPAGWIALGIGYAAYPAAALLWIHLPSWVGRGVEQVFYGAWQSLRGLLRVAGATKRDTNLYERLEAFGERHFRASKWNAVWLIPGVWLPIMAVEAVKYAVAGAAGLWVGAVSAPVNLLWGSSYKLFGAGRATAYFAEASRFVFDRVPNGKASLFNKAEALVLPWTNSASFPVRAAGSVAMGVLQVGWSLAAIVAAPLLTVAGLVVAFGRMGTYDSKRHDPSSLSVNREDSPGAKPQEPTEPGPTEPAKAPLAPKIVAAALALIPAWYFGVPLFMGTLYHGIGILYGLLVLPLAALPFMGPKTPGFLKSLAARGMIYNGLILLLSGHAIWAGAVAALAGWGFSRWVKSTADGKGGRFDGDSQIGAYFGALGSAVAVGAAWVGLAGFWGNAALALAVLTSPFLLVNLPSWVGAGVAAVFRRGLRSAGDAHDALSYWDEHTGFTSNLSAQASYWLKQSYLHGLWLWIPWVPVRVVQLADFAAALVVGLVTGVVRAPLSFLAAATKDARRDGRAAAFFGAWQDSWNAAAEGGRGRLERWIGALKPAVEAKTAVTGRPTFGAFAAMLGVQLLTLGWLVGVLLVNLSGAGLLWGLFQGLRAALAWTPKPKSQD